MKLPIRKSKYPPKILTEKQVREIRALHGVISQTQIAKKYGRSQASINAILHFYTYRWVKPLK